MPRTRASSSADAQCPNQARAAKASAASQFSPVQRAAAAAVLETSRQSGGGVRVQSGQSASDRAPTPSDSEALESNPSAAQAAERPGGGSAHCGRRGGESGGGIGCTKEGWGRSESASLPAPLLERVRAQLALRRDRRRSGRDVGSLGGAGGSAALVGPAADAQLAAGPLEGGGGHAGGGGGLEEGEVGQAGEERRRHLHASW